MSTFFLSKGCPRTHWVWAAGPGGPRAVLSARWLVPPQETCRASCCKLKWGLWSLITSPQQHSGGHSSSMDPNSALFLPQGSWLRPPLGAERDPRVPAAPLAARAIRAQAWAEKWPSQGPALGYKPPGQMGEVAEGLGTPRGMGGVGGAAGLGRWPPCQTTTPTAVIWGSSQEYRRA